MVVAVQDKYVLLNDEKGSGEGEEACTKLCLR